MSALSSVKALATLLKVTIDDDDPYARLILEQASTSVRDAAGQPGWTLSPDPLVLSESLPPQAAIDITLWVAQRAYTNPRNLSRRGSGPISEAFADIGVYGVELTDGELARIKGASGAKKGGLWALPIATAGDTTPYPLTVPDMIDGTPFTIADSDQFPYVNYV